MFDFQGTREERLFSRSLALFIPTNVCNEEFEYLIKQADQINQAKNLLLESDISTEDYLEAVEFFGVNVDKYLVEINQNLTQNLNDLYR